ncbi:MAG: hypothetical protein IJJ92_01790 [Clostridia bacterium]|nr:hypothetical protein [Clostridia bacterium]
MIATSQQKRSILICLYTLLLIALSIFLFWKCRYGYANADETFFIAVPFRLCRGDSLFVHEWNPAQLFSFLLYPAVRLFLGFMGSTEGILLAFRYLFTISWILCAIFIVYRFRFISLQGGMLASILFLLFTPSGIMALSYNSMGIMLVLATCIILATAKTRIAFQHCIAGILFAGAVLCCPYLVFLYLFFTIIIIILGIKKKWLIKEWLFFSFGCLILFVVFLLFLLNRARLSDIIEALPQLLKHPTHAYTPLHLQIYKFIKTILYCNSIFDWGLLFAVLTMIISRIVKDKFVGLAVLSLIVIALQVAFLVEDPFINHVMFPINIIAPFFLLHTSHYAKDLRNIFLTFWLPGALYTFCIFLSSDTGFFAISAASSVMTVATVIMLCKYLSGSFCEMKSRYTACIIIVALTLLIGVQFGEELWFRYSYVFWEDQGVRGQTVCAQSGPEKGILMTPQRFKKYTILEQDMSIIRSDSAIKNLLVLSSTSHGYLLADKNMSTYSAWLGNVNDNSISQLDTYFSMNPDKTPDGIFIEERYSKYIDHYLRDGYYHCEKMPSGAYLLKR